MMPNGNVEVRYLLRRAALFSAAELHFAHRLHCRENGFMSAMMRADTWRGVIAGINGRN